MYLIVAVLWFYCLCEASVFGHEEEYSIPDVCYRKLNSKDWILSKRDSDNGWGEETHRAVIALAVEDPEFFNDTHEGSLVARQLQIELSKALLRNSTGVPMHISDLSLFIHALLAVKINPKSFYGEDLVAMLEHRVAVKTHPHPLSVLALCNSGVVKKEYLDKIYGFLTVQDLSIKSRELQAIALKAFACAVDTDPSLYLYSQEVGRRAQEIYTSLWTGEGSFGNIYTTALVTQALVASNFDWRMSITFQYLRSRMSDNVNMLSAYCILLALNSDKVKFIKDIAPRLQPLVTQDGFPSIYELRGRPRSHFIQYSIRREKMPLFYFTVTIKIPVNASFFDVMRLVAAEDSNFEFLYSVSRTGSPDIYSISGIPNDPDNGYYWRLMKEDSVDHNRHVSNVTEINSSTDKLLPLEGTHWFYWYASVFEQFPSTTAQENSFPSYIVQ